MDRKYLKRLYLMRMWRRVIFFWIGTLVAIHAEWSIQNTENSNLPKQALFMKTSVTDGNHEVSLSGVLVSARHFRFQVIDNPHPKGSHLAEIGHHSGALAAINGGYFTEEFRPVGLLISNGKTIQSLQKAKLLSGVFSVTREHPQIQRTTEFSGEPDQAIQCGPFLISEGRPSVGLNATRSARRTVILEDGQGRWVLLVTTHVTLHDLAQILMVPDLFGNFKVIRALNFDGGSSTGLWVDLPGTPYYRPPFASVRDYLVVIPRR